MRIFMPFIVAAALLPAGVSFGAAPEPKSEEQKTLYAIGVAISNSLAPFDLSEAELEMVKAGLTDGALGREPKVDLGTYGPKIRELQQARTQAAAKEAKQAGASYLEKASAKKGSTRTESGALYTPIEKGQGASPESSDTVTVHYTGTLIDGKVFDSSRARGEPATFGLDQVIPCWTEGLQLMQVGGKGRLICPSDLAYGDSGRPPQIPPGATLVFEVELLDIAKQ